MHKGCAQGSVRKAGLLQGGEQQRDEHQLRHDARHGGLGRTLYEALADRLQAMGILNLYACIGYPQVEDEYLTKNSAQFHEHLGFALVGTFHNCGYKFGRWYDMVWMEKMIGEHKVPQPQIIWFSQLPEA